MDTAILNWNVLGSQFVAKLVNSKTGMYSNVYKNLLEPEICSEWLT